MSVKLNSDYSDVEVIKEAMTKKGGSVKLPYDNIIKVYMDHSKLAQETENQDFRLSLASLHALDEKLGGKVGKTGLVTIKRMYLTHLLDDHDTMMGMVEKTGTKYTKTY